MKNIKSLVILPLIPILAYVMLDFFIKNERLSLLLAISIGLIEFFATLIIYKKPDFFIFIDIVILLILGGISIFFNNPLFFLFKPAVIESFMLILMIVFTIYPEIYSRYMKRFIKKEINIQTNGFKSLLLIFDIILLSHIILIIIAALFANKAVWGFVSTLLLYIMFGVVFLLIFIINFIKQRIQISKKANLQE